VLLQQGCGSRSIGARCGVRTGASCKSVASCCCCSTCERRSIFWESEWRPNLACSCFRRLRHRGSQPLGVAVLKTHISLALEGWCSKSRMAHTANCRKYRKATCNREQQSLTFASMCCALYIVLRSLTLCMCFQVSAPTKLPLAIFNHAIGTCMLWSPRHCMFTDEWMKSKGMQRRCQHNVWSLKIREG
jgi:hypothetical protein